MTSRVYLHPIGSRDAGGAIGLPGARQGQDVALILRDPQGRRTHVRQVVPADVADAIAELPAALAVQADAQWRALSDRRTAIVLRHGELSCDPAAVMGIVNATPDSFSDGGAYLDAGDEGAHAAAMRAAGATIIDIGGESTRPGAPPVAEAEELRRVIPAVERIAGDGGIVSIDTRRAAVMAAALAAGAAIINDVSALRHDPASLAVAAAAECPVVLMHAPGEGDDLHAHSDRYRDVVLDVFDFLAARRDAAIAGGIAPQRIILDPGIGFGKSLADNLALLRALPLFHALGCPLLVGASRKRMIAAIAGEAPPGHRLGGSLALALAALDGGAQILRVHDAAETAQAAAVWRALRGSWS